MDALRGAKCNQDFGKNSRFRHPVASRGVLRCSPLESIVIGQSDILAWLNQSQAVGSLYKTGDHVNALSGRFTC